MRKNTVEIWKPIRGYEGWYEVSNLGRVKSVERDVIYYVNGKQFVRHYKEKIKEPNTNRGGYLYVILYKNGVGETKRVHRLVAEAFIPNEENKPEIDHINTIRDDNRVENLRWATHQENNNNELTLAKHFEKLINREDMSKPVNQYTLEGELIKVWPSISDCGRSGFCYQHISKCCNGKRKTHKGYVWSFN